MIQLLASNHNPLRTKHPAFYDRFYDLLARTHLLRIGVGYITQDSLAELLQVVNKNRKPNVELVIGMHHFQGFEKPQLLAAQKLHTFLTQEKMGGVFVSTGFPYHGKAYSFSDASGKVFAGIVGSNNLSSIVQSTSRVYESAVCIEGEPALGDLDRFLQDLIKVCPSVEGLDTRIVQNSAPLHNIQEAEQVANIQLAHYINIATGAHFKIPLKADPLKHGKSNLNVYFGKGRVNPRTGIEIPRPWYEVEIIVPKDVTDKPSYPDPSVNGGVFTVITDDGWKFNCKVSGDYSKNLRSEGSLSILGRWIKGRLENEGLLTPGEMITDSMLQKYGRNTLDLINTKEANVWLLKFDTP